MVWRVLLLRSDTRLTPSEIAMRAVWEATIILLCGGAAEHPFCVFPRETLSTRAKRDRRAHTGIRMSRFLYFGFRSLAGRSDLRPSPILLGVSRDTPVQTPRKPKRRTRSRSAGSRYSGCVLAPQLLSPPTPICCSATRTTVWCTGGNSYAWAAFSSSCGV